MTARLTLPLLDGFGLDTEIELTFRRDTVEVTHQGLCRGVFDRDVLKEWLAYPMRTLITDDVSFILSTDGILMRVDPGIPGCPLTQSSLEQLRSRV